MYHKIPIYPDKKIDDFYSFLDNSLPLNEYYEKIKLDVFRSKHYISPDAWADTIPSERLIRRLPEEMSDYRLPIEKHEVIHNKLPDASEDFVHNAAYNPSFDVELKSFRLVYH